VVAVTNAPKAPKQPVDIVRHGDVRVDPYYWMMDRSDEVLEHLRAENDFTAASLAPLRELEEEIFADMKARHRRD
jgi:oligopeptidase B